MKLIKSLTIAAALAASIVPATRVSADSAIQPTAGRLLVSGLAGPIGGTIGPDHALYVPEGVLGRITRIDPQTGATSTFADGLPPQVIPLGGVVDVAFVGQTAYALVTLVSSDVGGSSVDGIYRIDDANHSTVIADLGAWSMDHPPSPTFPIDVPTGLQYALERVGGGFLVSDGHHNRVLRVTFRGDVSEEIQFDNVVPTGLAVHGRTVYVSQAGPVPHLPSTGKIVAFDARRHRVRTVADGYSLMVDVEFGRRNRLYAISQGDSPGDVEPASPALPDSGTLLLVDEDGTLTPLVEQLDLPTSVHLIGNTALVVTLNGEVWRIDHLDQLGGGHHRCGDDDDDDR